MYTTHDDAKARIEYHSCAVVDQRLTTVKSAEQLTTRVLEAEAEAEAVGFVSRFQIREMDSIHCGLSLSTSTHA